MSIPGAIAERARAVLPVTWDALSRDPRYGDGFLSLTIQTVQERVYGRVIPESEENTLPLIVIDFIAKLVAIEMVTPGIDFWMNEATTVTATGTNETTSFADRAEKLRLLRADLLAETRRLANDVGPLIDFKRPSGAARPRMNTIDDELLTPSPQQFPRPFSVR